MRGEQQRNGSPSRNPLALARRFGASVPGQILVNTAVFRLPEELRIRSDWRVLEVAAGRASLTRVLAERSDLDRPPVAIDASPELVRDARLDAASWRRIGRAVMRFVVRAAVRGRFVRPDRFQPRVQVAVRR